jgi:hypothetical protein
MECRIIDHVNSELQTAKIGISERSKASIIFASQNNEIMGSSPSRGMDSCVFLFCVYVVLCVSRVQPIL